MLAPQRGQTRLRIAEIKLGLVLVTANETIMYLLVVAVLHHRMHRTLARLGRGARLIGMRPLASDSHVRATELPKCFARNERSISRQKIEWKFECRGDGCWCVNLAYSTLNAREITK